MQKVIDVDFQVRWHLPLYIRIGTSERERVDGPDAALSALRHRWKCRESDRYHQAKARCLAAVAWHGSAELARESFLKAAVEAKVLA